MQSILRRAIIILVVTVFVISAAFPLSRMRLSKDLAGGITLVYSVRIGADEDADQVLSKTIEVLKERLDPDGLLEIQMVALGRDRIEISMPLPTDEVKKLKAEFEQTLADLGRHALDQSALDLLMRSPPEARAARIAELTRDDPERRGLFEKAAAAFDEAARLSAEHAAARDAGAESAALTPLLAAAGKASIAFDEARAAALKASVSSEDLRHALQQRARGDRKTDDKTGKFVDLPSPRERALTRLKEAHPGSSGEIDRVLASYQAYESKRRSLDDPQDLVRLLQGSGVLEFRITPRPGENQAEETRLREELRERGPRNVRVGTPAMRWFKINRLEGWYNSVQGLESLMANPSGYFRGRGLVGEEYDGEYYVLAYDTRDRRMTAAEGQGAWKVANARAGQDDIGLPAIDFEMDPLGAGLLGALTEPHIGREMAILLDDQIYTVATLQSRLSTGGKISGKFDDAELNYIIRVLGSGSLQAKLSSEPISVDTQAPELGRDNLVNGVRSGFISFGVCAVFLIGYYFSCGGIACVGLVLNALMLIGAMALARSPISMPGIAGIILTFAMAVDANVLIYERMREEILRGESLKAAIRLGYQRALSAIVDGNLTNLIVCAVLYQFGTQEIRGFSVTMSIGVLTTLFTQLFCTRLLFDIFVEKLGWRKASMLPIRVPAVQRLFDLRVDWMRLRPVFSAIAVGAVALSTIVIVVQGGQMLDNEFRGGTAITLELKKKADGTPTTLTRAEVERRLLAKADEGDAALRDLRNAEILVLNAEADGVSSDTFKIKTLLTDTATLTAAIGSSFSDVIDSAPKIHFDGDTSAPVSAAVFPILEARLGRNISRSDVNDDVGPFVGGAAVVLANLDPPTTVADLAARIKRVRSQKLFTDTLARQVSVVVLDGAPDAVRSAAVLINDPSVSYFTDAASWDAEIRDREWAIVTGAMDAQSQLLSVQSFSPAVARAFTAQAVSSLALSILLVVVYVWVRFSSFRFALAAVIATLHDCYVALGLIAGAELLYYAAPGIAGPLGIMPFKIDLTLIAAMLTILGYSINDKIVVMDRIRENRGKLKYVSRACVNDSINQTLSRTLMTGSTTIISLVVLYMIGGTGLRGFAYSLGLGVIIGTYSSIAIGAPLIWSRKLDRDAEPAPEAPALKPAS